MNSFVAHQRLLRTEFLPAEPADIAVARELSLHIRLYVMNLLYVLHQFRNSFKHRVAVITLAPEVNLTMYSLETLRNYYNDGKYIFLSLKHTNKCRINTVYQ